MRPFLYLRVWWRRAPSAEKLGTTADLTALDLLSCEGERQLKIGDREGLYAACADLVERTLG